MIALYYWPTPNGWKVTIMLEELGLAYEVIPVNIGKGDQFAPEFLALSPNNKIPAIVDPDGPDGRPMAVFESGAILLYLAEKTGRFFAPDSRGKYEVLQWLFFQMGNVGPFFGQANHFNRYAPEPVPYAIARYNNEAKRLLGVMDGRLAAHEYFGPDYGIADMALFGWARDFAKDEGAFAEAPNVKRWYDAILVRPAVQRGLAVTAAGATGGAMDDEAKAILFGDQQYARR